MNNLQIVDQEKIKEIIPHRYENLLIDSTVEEEGKMLFQSHITRPDVLGRDVFLYNKDLGLGIQTPILAEILALASIISNNPSSQQLVALFASISNFQLHQPFKSAQLNGWVKPKKVKKDFFIYEGFVEGACGGKASAQLMAYATHPTELHQLDHQGKPYDLPELMSSNFMFPSLIKPADMFCIDSIEYCDLNRIVTAYTYPLNHPFIKGHFPDKPIMMGVMQWMMAEDALLAHVLDASTSYSNSKQEVCAQAVIVNEKKQIVCQLKNLVFELMYLENQQPIVYCKKARQILFKNVVNPGNRLYCDLQIEHL